MWRYTSQNLVFAPFQNRFRYHKQSRTQVFRYDFKTKAKTRAQQIDTYPQHRISSAIKLNPITTDNWIRLEPCHAPCLEWKQRNCADPTFLQLKRLDSALTVTFMRIEGNALCSGDNMCFARLKWRELFGFQISIKMSFFQNFMFLKGNTTDFSLEIVLSINCSIRN